MPSSGELCPLDAVVVAQRGKLGDVAGPLYCVIDPGPAWFNALSAPLERLADPGWIGRKTPEEFRALLEGAGFTRSCWIPLLPGFGLAIGQKAA